MFATYRLHTRSLARILSTVCVCVFFYRYILYSRSFFSILLRCCFFLSLISLYVQCVVFFFEHCLCSLDVAAAVFFFFFNFQRLASSSDRVFLNACQLFLVHSFRCMLCARVRARARASKHFVSVVFLLLIM